MVNAYLVRWARGLIAVEEPASIAIYGRHEGYLALGGSQSPEDASRVAHAVLGVRSNPQVATTIGLRPLGIVDRPYDDFDLGDWLPTPDEDGALTSARVRSLMTQDHPDNTGEVQFVPELRNVSAEAEDVLGRWLQRMATGGGASGAATPPIVIPTPLRAEKVPIPPFSLAVVSVKASGRWYVPEAMRIVRWTASITDPGSSTTTAVLYRSEVPVAEISWVAGQIGPQTVQLEVDLTTAHYLTTAVTAAGPGALNLVTQPNAV